MERHIKNLVEQEVAFSPELPPPDYTSDENTSSEVYIKYLKHLSTNWSSHGAAKLLSKPVVEYIIPRIHRCSTPLKVRILTSLLYISETVRECSKADLMLLLNLCETDRDDWVRKLSRLLQPYIQTGYLSLSYVDTETAYRIIKYLDDQRRVTKETYRLKRPLETFKVYDCTRNKAETETLLQSGGSNQEFNPLKKAANPEERHFIVSSKFTNLTTDIEEEGLSIIRKVLIQHKQINRIIYK